MDGFARFFALPQTGHGLSGNIYAIDGDEKRLSRSPFRIRSTASPYWSIGWKTGKLLESRFQCTAGTRSLPMRVRTRSIPSTKSARSGGRHVLQLRGEVNAYRVRSFEELKDPGMVCVITVP